MKRTTLSALAATLLAALSLVALASPSAAQTGTTGTGTNITASPGSITYGDETGASFTIDICSSFLLCTVNVPATGTVDVSATLGSTTTPLCTVTLAASDNGVGSCSLSPGTDTLLGGGSYQLAATYSGDDTYTGSTSPQVPLTVTQAPTTVAVTPTPTTVTYGNENTVSFGVTVSPQVSGGAPTGSVSVLSGSTPLCTVTLVQSDNGAGSCSPLSGTALGAGSAPITAVYNGDANFGVSPTSPASTLTVAQASTTVAVTPSPATVAFGQETTVSFGVTVSPQVSGGAPTGSVSVMSGSTPLCTVTLVQSDNGSGSCSPLSGTALGAGSAPITALYNGDANFDASPTSPASTLTVTTASSTTALHLSSPTVTYGNESTEGFTVDVTSVVAGVPTGSVSVMSGVTTLCSFTLDASDNGTGSCSPNAGSDTVLGASPTPYQLTAVYGGDGTYAGSTSPQVPLTVDQASTTVAVTPTPTTVTYGNETTVSFGVTVSPQVSGAPTGSVSVMSGSTPLCTVTLVQSDNGSGSCSPLSGAVLGAGSPPITAVYNGDANFGASPTSPASTLTVAQAPTTVAVTPTPTTVTYGNENTVSFGVTVSPQVSGGAPTGSVSVLSGSTPLCTVTLVQSDNGAGSCSPLSGAALGAGSAPITAVYNGDANFGVSPTSPASTLTVTQASTTVAVTPSPATVAFGQETTVSFGVTVSPQVAGGAPTGSVSVMSGSTPLCTVTLVQSDNGSGSCSPLSGTALGAGSAPITALYNGDANFDASPTSPASTLTVTTASSTTALHLSSPTVTYGNESTEGFTVDVTSVVAGVPTGSVSVMSGVTTLCSFTLDASDNGTGSCSPNAGSDTVLGASPTPYQLTAVYGGDGTYAGSTSPQVPLTVDQASTTVAVTPTPTTVTYGNETTVSFGVTVSPQVSGAPTGSVSVMSGSTPLCTVTLVQSDNGSGSCSPLSGAVLGAGSPPITAVYNGDANFGASPTSPASTLTVAQASTTTTVSVSPNSVNYGSESTVTFRATVAPPTGFAGTPTGTVALLADGITPLCTVNLSNGTGTCTTGDETLVPSGSTYQVTGTYNGDPNFSASPPSPGSGLTVTGGNSATGLTPSNPSVTFGNETSESFTVTVTPLHSGTGTPMGRFTVTTGTTTLCSSTLSNGTGTCNVTGNILLGGSSTYPVTANFTTGDDDFNSSQSSTQSLTVVQATTGTVLTVAPSTVTYGGESAATFSATITPEFPGTPTGTITVAAGSTTLCTIKLAKATSCSTGPTTLYAAGYTVTATYGGDGNFRSSSGSNNLTVNQGTPSSPSIANLPSGAAEEGNFEASVNTSGDGARTVVSDTTGTCTVGGDGVTVSFLVAGACTLTPQVSSGQNYIGAAGSPQTFTIGFGPRGYWLVGSDGGIFSFGTAQFYGSMGGIPLQRPVVGITPTHTKHGYWLVASDGGIFSFGDSNFYGSIPGVGLHPAGSGQPNSLDAPIVGMVPSTDGNGYFMVASDGGVFAFGDARFAGSCPGIGGCAGAAVAVMPDHSGNGYWLVTAAGAIYAFGDAPFFGAPADQSSPVVNAVATPDGEGYWILYANGTVLNFGDAAPYGNPLGYVNGFNPATSIFPTTDGLGYWVASAKGDVFSYGNAPFLGSMSATPLNGPIIAAFGF